MTWEIFDVLGEDIAGIIKTSEIVDVFDILFVTFILYQLFRMVRETRAVQLIKGIILMIGIWFAATILQLSTLSYIMENIFTIGAYALILIFHPELRRALEQMGRTKFSGFDFGFGSSNDQENQKWKNTISVIGEASAFLCKRKIGALIVLERQSKLGEIVKTGTMIDSNLTPEILGNIFFPNSPLHDGALIIRDGRVLSAACYLPLSENYDISKEMGTRHRAALGMSEQSDAIIVIVSEETGVITVAQDGKLKRGYTQEQLTRELESIFILEPKEDKGERKLPFKKNKKNNDHDQS